MLLQFNYTETTSCNDKLYYLRYVRDHPKKYALKRATHIGLLTILFFLFCSDTLGLVPIWGHAHEGVAKSVHSKLHVSENELGILYGAYREDNVNSK